MTLIFDLLNETGTKPAYLMSDIQHVYLMSQMTLINDLDTDFSF